LNVDGFDDWSSQVAGDQEAESAVSQAFPWRITVRSVQFTSMTCWIGRLALVGSWLIVGEFGLAAEREPVQKGVQKDQVLTNFSLTDTTGVTHSLSDVPAGNSLAILVLGTECPVAQRYATRFAELATAYRTKTVTFAAIAPNSQDSLAELTAMVKDLELPYPVMRDVGQKVADQLGATRTPEVFLLDSNRMVVYRGRVDDQYTPGKSLAAPKRADFELALKSVLAGEPIEVAETQPVGCLIGRVRDGAAKSDQAIQVTYAEHVAPLLNKHCVECHRPGEIGPFSLTDYDSAAGWAEMMVEVTSSGRMPPWHADPAHGEFANSRGLSTTERQLLKDWIAAGVPEGNRDLVPETPQFTAGWQLPREPDLVISMSPKPVEVPASGVVEYKYFFTPSGLTEDRWFRAAEVVPGNRAIVHHVIVFARVPGAQGEGTFLAAYVPGLRTTPLPKGMAKRLPAGSQIVFQMHYTPNGKAQTDDTKIGFLFVDESTLTHEVRTENVEQKKLAIVPELADQEVKTKTVTSPTDVLLLSFSPHMHLRGQSFRYEMTWPDGQTETLLDVPQYDFNWQTAYRLKTPREVPTGSQLVAYAKFDNSKKNLANPDPSATVGWGDQSWDEMCLGYFDIAIPIEEAKNVPYDLTRALRPGLAPEVAGPRLLKLLDRNRDGVVTLAEVPANRHELFHEVDTDKNEQLTQEELGAGAATIRKALLTRAKR
jgi:peroxiredoxin